MDSRDFKLLLDMVNRRIQRSAPMTAEYWRGYSQGIKEYYQQIGQEPADQGHHRIIDKDQSEPFFDAYARGYCDGLKGRMV